MYPYIFIYFCIFVCIYTAAASLNKQFIVKNREMEEKEKEWPLAEFEKKQH